MDPLHFSHSRALGKAYCSTMLLLRSRYLLEVLPMVRVLVASSPVPLFSRAGRRAAWQIEVEKPRLPGVKGRGASRCIVPFVRNNLTQTTVLIIS